MPAPPEIVDLVKRFDQYYTKYTSPSYNENPEPAYQVRRYAWSAKLPVSHSRGVR